MAAADAAKGARRPKLSWWNDQTNNTKKKSVTSRQSLNGSPLVKVVKATVTGDKISFNIEKTFKKRQTSEIFCHVTQDFKATFQTSQHLHHKLQLSN